jgi:5-dehydro-2-deoxygluconokinase
MRTQALEVLTMGRALVDFYPTRDGALSVGSRFETSVGGSPTNVAIAASRLGRRTGVISCIGADPLGLLLLKGLEAEGVDIRGVQVSGEVLTPVAVCEISPPDDFPLSIYRPAPAADQLIDRDKLDSQVIESANILWMTSSGLSGGIGRDAHYRALDLRNGNPVIIDLDLRPGFWASEREAKRVIREVLPGMSVAVGNVSESKFVTGVAEPHDAALALLDLGVQLAIVKRGPDGVLAKSKDFEMEASPIAVKIINGIGSGDAFGGALCDGLLAGLDMQQVIEFANAAGALVASRRGCSTAFGTRREVEALMGGRESSTPASS